MTVIVLNDTPPFIRGILKRWFVEPKPNVFVGTVNRKTRGATLDYVRRNAPGLGMLVISGDDSCQGFSIKTFGPVDRKEVTYCGLNLIAEKWNKNGLRPQGDL